MFDVTNYPAEARQQFLQKTLPIFGFMLLITGVVTYWMAASGAWMAVARMGLIGMLLLFGVQIGMIYGARAFRESYPFNIVFAIAFAVVEGVFISPLIAIYLAANPIVIGQALVITSFIMLGLAAVVWFTNRDFRPMGMFLIMAVFGLIGLSLLQFIVGQFPSGIQLAINVGTIVIFSLFVLYDMSKILKNEFGPVGGAISLYIDFIVIFIHLLQLLGSRE
ncbi:MAG: Bax inhibitor-1/YccA family protein [Candidatus Nanohaloarchaea archaeon]|nr:Bax inhibitor-1/YccA family protein [Candidatus Nanohaloarchaea archaeon]